MLIPCRFLVSASRGEHHPEHYHRLLLLRYVVDWWMVGKDFETVELIVCGAQAAGKKVLVPEQFAAGEEPKVQTACGSVAVYQMETVQLGQRIFAVWERLMGELWGTDSCVRAVAVRPCVRRFSNR